MPGYINPTADPAAWAQLAKSTPQSVGFVVANVLNGPDYIPAPDWAAVIHNVSASGVKVFGYVDTGYLGTTGQRTRLGSSDSIDWMSQIERDVAAWYAFYGSDLTGIFFDQAQNACGPTLDSNEWADQYRYLTEEVKRLHPGATTVDNPGIGVPQCYEAAADVIVTFEGSYASYVNDPSAPNPYTPLSWDPVDPKKIWHIVYGVPDVAAMSQTVELSKTRSAGYVYVTNDVLANPYDELPPTDYWTSEEAVASALPPGELSPPSPPTTLDTVQVYSTRIDLDWEPSQGGSAPVVAYDIYRDGVGVDSVGADTVTYSAVNLTPRTVYTFAVVARDAFGLTSQTSNSMTARADQTYGDPRRPPDGFAASGTTFTSTHLGWDPSRRGWHSRRPDVDAYIVLQNGREILRLPSTVTDVTVGGLAPDSTYAFSVLSIDRSGDRTGESPTTTVTTPALPNGQTIGQHSVVQSPDAFSFSAEFLVPFAFRRVFISTGATGAMCWPTSTDPSICADYLLENERLYHYSGVGTDWDWTIVKDVVPQLTDSTYTWTIAPIDIGSPASVLVVFNASGYAPNSNCGPTDTCTVTGPPLPYE
ncbi:MAG: spherulation-specific family 4 protein [Ilumatobacteraceae bacterium]